MVVKTIDLTRNIRDKNYKNIKDLSKEEQIKYYRSKASKLNKKFSKNKKAPV